MNELELLFKAEIANKQNVKNAHDEYMKDYRKKLREYQNGIVGKLSFLKNYGFEIKTEYSSSINLERIEKDGHRRSIELAFTSERKNILGSLEWICTFENSFCVDWNYNICHRSDENQKLTLDEFVKKLATKLA